MIFQEAFCSILRVTQSESHDLRHTPHKCLPSHGPTGVLLAEGKTCFALGAPSYGRKKATQPLSNLKGPSYLLLLVRDPTAKYHCAVLHAVVSYKHNLSSVHRRLNAISACCKREICTCPAAWLHLGSRH